MALLVSGRVPKLWRLPHVLRHFDILRRHPFSGLWKMCIVSTHISKRKWGKCRISTPIVLSKFGKMYSFNPLFCSIYSQREELSIPIRNPTENANPALRWRRNEHDGVLNRQPFHCLLSRLFGRRSKKTSKLRVTGLCVGNSPGPVNSSHEGPGTRKIFPFDDVIMRAFQFCSPVLRSGTVHGLCHSSSYV